VKTTFTIMTAVDPSQQDTAQPLSSSEFFHPIETIFIWDFDWTIINCNSDEYVPAGFLGGEDVAKRISAEMKAHGPTKWHECVANLINACMLEKACSKDDILEKAAQMPFLIDVKQALTDVANNKQFGQAIISDGNDKFIEAYLRKNEMIHFFTHGIETNVGTWERNDSSETLFKITYQSVKYGGHECNNCPPNLCKTKVLKDILKSNGEDRPRIVYVGDGHNDACPALHVLNGNDILLARNGKRCPNPNSFSGPHADKNHEAASESGTFAILATLEKAEKREGLVPKCRVCPWNTGKELLSLVHGILNEKSE
jgi:pyridoxal phosphate phosphatase PHOSPHO2